MKRRPRKQPGASARVSAAEKSAAAAARDAATSQAFLTAENYDLVEDCRRQNLLLQKQEFHDCKMNMQHPNILTGVDDNTPASALLEAMYQTPNHESEVLSAVVDEPPAPGISAATAGLACSPNEQVVEYVLAPRQRG